MAKKRKRSSIMPADLVAEYFDQRDEQVMQALVTAGAFVALADGRVKDVERAELLSYVEGQDLVPTIARQEIVEAFDNRVGEIEDRGSVKVIVDAFRPLVGRSPSSFLVRVAERVAAADGYLHPNELQSIELVRLIVTKPPSDRSKSSGGGSLCAPSEATTQAHEPSRGAKTRPLDPGTPILLHEAPALRT
jgi:tellurite resistance protein